VTSIAVEVELRLRPRLVELLGRKKEEEGGG